MNGPERAEHAQMADITTHRSPADAAAMHIDKAATVSAAEGRAAEQSATTDASAPANARPRLLSNGLDREQTETSTPENHRPAQVASGSAPPRAGDHAQDLQTATGILPQARPLSTPSATSPPQKRTPRVVDLAAGVPRRASAPHELAYNSAKTRPLKPTDGRPCATPTGLHDKANTADGSFGMIQIDLTQMTRGERIAAAQRSSEGTAAAASGAVPQWNDPCHHQSWKSSSSGPAAEAPGRPLRWREVERAAPAPPQYDPSRYQPMAPADLAARGWPITIPPPNETKADQARLMELFRTIHPTSIVDQLCKGLAFFGGVPGQPPPPDGNFPPSDKHNGSGALFVRWLSEIFPPVQGHGSGQTARSSAAANAANAAHPPPAASVASPAAAPAPAAPPTDAPTTQRSQRVRYDAYGNPLPKRPRGRPLGSANKHPRRDKGTRKGPRRHLDTAPAAEDAGSPLRFRPILTPNGKRLGRPPGSKNRPKALPNPTAQTANADAAGGPSAARQGSPSQSRPGPSRLEQPAAGDTQGNPVRIKSEPSSESSSESAASDDGVRNATAAPAAVRSDATPQNPPPPPDQASPHSEQAQTARPASSAPSDFASGSIESPDAAAHAGRTQKRRPSTLATADDETPDATRQPAAGADQQSKRRRLAVDPERGGPVPEHAAAPGPPAAALARPQDAYTSAGPSLPHSSSASGQPVSSSTGPHSPLSPTTGLKQQQQQQQEHLTGSHQHSR